MSAAKDLIQPKVDYETLERERSLALQRDIQIQLANQKLGKIDSLRHVVLKSVVSGDYEKAEFDLDRFIQLKKDYANFAPRTTGHFQHARELINAIRAKRNFPNKSALTMAKQQEILDHVLGHFEQLKSILHQIEKISREMALDDLRSTVILLRVFCYSILAIVSVAFALDFMVSIGQPMTIVFHDITNLMFQWLGPKLGF
jgi:hypothetical protein